MASIPLFLQANRFFSPRRIVASVSSFVFSVRYDLRFLKLLRDFERMPYSPLYPTRSKVLFPKKVTFESLLTAPFIVFWFMPFFPRWSRLLIP